MKLEILEGESTTIEAPAFFTSLLSDPSITEILINGPEEIWIERGGSLTMHPEVFDSEDVLRRWLRKMLSERGRKVDHATPFADCTLPDGSRLHAVAPPISRKGICLSLRKFPSSPWTLPSLAQSGALSSHCLSYLESAVRARKNIFLSGGTGTGKTSLLAALLANASIGDRIVALEDTAELRVKHPHFISLEARPPNQEGEGEIGLRRLLREALRMRPDRLVIGECRGGEALDLLLALNTGHAGSMGTIHANSPRDALQRLETLGMLASENIAESALRNLIVGGVHVVVQLERTCMGRRIASISEVKGVDGGRFLLKEISI